MKKTNFMVIMAKRGADNDQLVEVPQPSKKIRNEIENYRDKQLASAGVERMSNLFAPIMQLQGHKGDIFSCDFHPDGDYLGTNFYEVKHPVNNIFNFSFNWFRQANISLVCFWRRMSKHIGYERSQRCSNAN